MHAPVQPPRNDSANEAAMALIADSILGDALTQQWDAMEKSKKAAKYHREAFKDDGNDQSGEPNNMPKAIVVEA